MTSDTCPTCPTGRLPFLSSLVCHTCWSLVPRALRDVLLGAWDHIGRPSSAGEMLEIAQDDAEGYRAYMTARREVIRTIVRRLRTFEEVSTDARLL